VPEELIAAVAVDYKAWRSEKAWDYDL
jgi:hypothetical protein